MCATVPREQRPYSADPRWPGHHLARLDTTGLANGPHVLSLEVTDDETGRNATVQQQVTILHGSAFGAGLVGPVPDSDVSGIVP